VFKVFTFSSSSYLFSLDEQIDRDDFMNTADDEQVLATLSSQSPSKLDTPQTSVTVDLSNVLSAPVSRFGQPPSNDVSVTREQLNAENEAIMTRLQNRLDKN
jgi:hypothetical protein